jgi:hypothetical protein
VTQRSIADQPVSPARPLATPLSGRSRSSQRSLRPTDRADILDELRRRQMMRLVPTAYSTAYRPWALSPRVNELLGVQRAGPMLDPFGSILSLSAEDRVRLSKLPLARTAYSLDFAPQNNAEIFRRVRFAWCWLLVSLTVVRLCCAVLRNVPDRVVVRKHPAVV